MNQNYKKLLKRPLISEKSYRDIIIASMKILDDYSLISLCSSIDSFDELYNFYQFVHTGSYSIEDLATAIYMNIAKLYYNSTEYIKDKIFEYISKDSKMHGGYDYLDKIKNFQNIIKNSKLVDFDNLNISGGTGYFDTKKYKRLLAGGLAFLSFTPPNTTATESAKSKDETDYTEQRKIKIENNLPQNKKWYEKLWDWTMEHIVPIGVGTIALLGLGCIGYVGYKEHKKRKKITDSPEIFDENMPSAKFFASLDSGGKLEEAAAVHIIKDKIESQNASSSKSARDKLATSEFLAKYGLGLGEQLTEQDTIGRTPYGLGDRTYKLPGAIKVNVGDKQGAYYKIEQLDPKKNTGQARITVAGKEINDKIDSLYGKEEDEKKRQHDGLWLAISTVGGGLSMLWNGTKNITNSVLDVGKKAGDLVKVIPDSIESASRIMRYSDPRELEWMFPTRRVTLPAQKTQKWSADEIFKMMKQYVKGQDDQLKALSADLSAFIVKVRTIGRDANEIDRMRQTVQRLLHVVGATGTGKSLMASVVESILDQAGIPSYRCNLTGWDDEKETIDAFLSKQKENESKFNSISNRPCLFIIEELDKVCNTPERSRKVTTWIHSVFDSGKFGGGEENPGAKMGLTYFLFTSNAIPSATDLKNKNVVGIDYSRGNYVEIMDFLSKTGGRSQPTSFHGSTQSRLWTIEMNEINEQSMPEVIESNLTPICDKLFRDLRLDVTWNKDCIKKLARTIHTSKYSSGGNRRIAAAICNSVIGACATLVGLPADQIKRDETGVAHYFLDFEGLDDEGNFIINLVDSKDKVKNEAKNIIIEDNDVFVDYRSQELENCILEEKISFLSATLSILADALALDPNEKWENLLSPNSMNFVDELVSTIPDSPSASSGLQLKFLVGSTIPLLESLRARKITDRQWESIKLLNDDVTRIMAPKINEARQKYQVEKGLKDFDILVPKLKTLEMQLKKLGNYSRFSTLAESNKIAINDISSLFGKKLISNSPSDSLKYIMTSGSTPSTKSMSRIVIKSISKLKSAVESQLRSVQDELNKNATIVISNLESVENELKDHEDVENISKGLSSSDDKYLSSLIDKIEAGKFVPSTKEKLLYVLENIPELKTYYNNNNGTSDDDARGSTALLSAIENIVDPKIIDVDTKISLDPAIQSELDYIFEEAATLTDRQDVLDSVMDNFTYSRRPLNALVSNDKYTRLKDKIIEIGNPENKESIISRLSEELKNKNVSIDEIIELRKSFTSAVSNLPALKRNENDDNKHDSDAKPNSNKTYQDEDIEYNDDDMEL